MDLAHIYQESELQTHISSFGFPLVAGEEECVRQLRGPWVSNTQILEQRAADVITLRKDPEVCAYAMKTLKSLKEAESILREHIPSETSKTAEGQILFQGEHTKVLNTIPYMIAILVFLKVWIAPLLALMTPLLLAVMPYVIMTTIMDMNITWDIYVSMMKHMVLGIQNGEPWRPKHYVQAIWTTISLGQGIVNPFITAYHTSNLDQTIVKRGQALIEIRLRCADVLDRLKAIGCFQTSPLVFPEVPMEPRQAAAWMDSEPLGVQTLWRLTGRLTIICTMASDKSWKPVQWTSNETLCLTDLSDLAIPSERAAKSALSLRGHSLLTGPNRGGKSSCLRAILQQVILGQTFGLTKGVQGSWKPYGQVFTRLKSRDHAGRESLFEMEVRMASIILKTIQTKRSHTLVLIDELFHSTNPPDAEISARLFLQQLWKFRYTKSIISTHIFSLCEGIQQTTETVDSAAGIQLLCCPAEESLTGIQYSYTLQSGICKVSSVREVLQENGLLTTALKQTVKKRPE
jgi:hypothetical protein